MNLKSIINGMLMLLAVGGMTLMSVGCTDVHTAMHREGGEREHGEREHRERGERGHDERGGGHEHGGELLQPNADANDAHKLHALLKQARNELREMRTLAGLHPHAAGPHVDPPGHHEGESESDREREGREREGHEDGEHGEKGHREGNEREHSDREGTGREREHADREGNGREREHTGREGKERSERGHREERHKRFSKLQKHDATYRNGARRVLQYNPITEAFAGSVQNTTKKTLSQVRVEIHLSNGLELGPTQRVDLKAGATIPVELSALDQNGNNHSVGTTYDQ